MVVDDFQEIEALAELGVSAGEQRRQQQHVMANHNVNKLFYHMQ